MRVELSLLSKYRSALMGFAILYIMIFHLERHAPFLNTHYFILGSSGVEVFLLLSGLGLYFSLSQAKYTTSWSFYKKRLIRILPAFWALIVPLSLFHYFNGDISLSMALIRILGLSAFIEGANGYWYISALLVCYIFTPPLQRYLRTTNKELLVVLIAFVVCYLISYKFGKVEILFTRVPVFVLGMYIGKLILNKKLQLNIFYVLVGFVFVFFATYIYRIRPSFNVILYRLLTNALALPLSLAVAYLLSKSTMSIIKHCLDFLGGISLELYLIHIFILKYVCPSINSIALYMLVFFIASIILSCLLHKLCEKMIQYK